MEPGRLLLTLSARRADIIGPALRRPIGPLHSAGTGNATHMLSCIDGLIRSESERPTKSWPASGVRSPSRVGMPATAEYYCATIGLVVLRLAWQRGNSDLFRAVQTQSLHTIFEACPPRL